MKTSTTRTALGHSRAVRLVPRNPLVAAARFRQAGAHGAGRKAQRQQARRALGETLIAEARERHRET
jgi:chorismate-pyruvate lyase